MKKKQELADIFNTELLLGYLKTLGLEEESDQFLTETIKELETKAKDLAKAKKNKNRIKANDLTKVHVKAESALTKLEINQLPSWVRREIKDAVLIGNSGDVIQVPDGRKYHRKNRLNDLPGGRWTYFLNSVINTRYPTSGVESYAHEIRKIHPSPKPPQLMRDIIEFFTKENEIVFDYFMGVGGTLLGASLAGRRAIGIDLNQEYIAAYKEANLSLELAEQETILGDSMEILRERKLLQKKLGKEKVSLILIDPPYGDMLAREKTGESMKKSRDSSPTPFTELPTDLGNMSIEEFFPVFQESVVNSMHFLKPKGHIAVFMKDLQPTKESTNLLHSRVIENLTKIDGLRYLGMKIWADQGVNLYPYGYPYAFVSNQIHQYVMFFRME